MTNKELNLLVAKWQKRLGLDSWKIEVNIEDLTPHTFALNLTSFSVGASCNTRWEYMIANLKFDEERIKTATVKEITLDVVHELLHIVINEMRNYDDDKLHEERVVTMLTSAFLRKL